MHDQAELSLIEFSRLSTLEAVIAKGLETFIEVGNAPLGEPRVVDLQ